MKRRHDRGNILTFGITLLLILLAGMFLVSRLLNDAGQDMNNAVANERSLVNYSRVESEFQRSVSLVGMAAELIADDSEELESAFESAAGVLLQLDSKISRVWLAGIPDRPNLVYSKDRGEAFVSRIPTGQELSTVGQLGDRPGTNGLYRCDSVWIWQVACRKTTDDGELILGADMTLADIFRFMTEQDIYTVRSAYLSIFSSDGTVIFYPDSLRIGKSLQDATEIRYIGEVASSGMTQKRTVLSEYISMPAERTYYALNMGGERWVVAVTVLHFTFTETLDEFHRYTVIIVLVAVILFTALLAYSQYRVRREHSRRLAAEQLSAEQQMNRLLEQVKPHFLFNALNSLYVLIKQDTGLARKFVLKLSAMYRYVLERRLAPLSTVERELDFLCQYMFLQETRFGDQIELDIHVGQEFLQKLIPSMSLQGLVENAIKHNAFSPESPLKIRIFTSNDSIVVENNYVFNERNPIDSTGLGLESLRIIYEYYTSAEVVCGRVGNVFRCVLPLLHSEK